MAVLLKLEQRHEYSSYRLTRSVKKTSSKSDVSRILLKSTLDLDCAHCSESVEASCTLCKAHADLLLRVLSRCPVGTCQRYTSSRVLCCLVIGLVCRYKISRAVSLQPQASSKTSNWFMKLCQSHVDHNRAIRPRESARNNRPEDLPSVRVSQSRQEIWRDFALPACFWTFAFTSDSR